MITRKTHFFLIVFFLVVSLFFDAGRGRAAAPLNEVLFESENSGIAAVSIAHGAGVEISTESRADKLVVILKNCLYENGTKSIPGDGKIVKEVVWSRHPDHVAYVVVHLAKPARHEILETPGITRVLFSDSTIPGHGDNPVFQVHSPVPETVASAMTSWKPGCPVPVEDLAYLQLSHWGYDGKPHVGEMIVHGKVASEVVEIFEDLYARKFPVEKMRLVEHYGCDDEKSMADNNSSSFNCRMVKGSRTRMSKHSYGLAIDINPLDNPYVKDNQVSPPGGRTDRTKAAKGMIVEGGPCHRAFDARGWKWGGDWKSLKDYQHFEKP